MQKLLVAPLMFVSVVAAACGTESESESELNAKDFRCRMNLSDGSCQTLPADCPVTFPVAHGTSPHCPLGADLIPIEEDDCAYKLICTD
jgi:hypothetical protein